MNLVSQQIGQINNEWELRKLKCLSETKGDTYLVKRQLQDLKRHHPCIVFSASFLLLFVFSPVCISFHFTPPVIIL